MLLTLTMAALFIIVTMFIIDVSREQVITSQVSTYLQPFAAETVVKHEFASRPDVIWNTLMQLSNYNFWFPGVLRILPVVESSRFVHQYSFDQFHFAPGAYIRLRPFSLSPSFGGRIMVLEEKKQLALELRFNPVHKETVVFDLDATPNGTSVTCRRTSRGLFSWMTLWGFSNNKSKILDNLGYFIPEEIVDEKDDDSTVHDSGPQYSREAIIARAVQAGLDGNMDLVNTIPDKPTRGLAKAVLLQTKRKGGAMPNKYVRALSEEPTAGVALITSQPRGGENFPVFTNQEDLIAYAVNKALDGDDEPLNAISDKPTRGKAKAMLVKIKRGTVDLPPMPEISTTAPAITPNDPTKPRKESEEEMILRLVDGGINGDMDEINALDNKAVRGKIKAAIVKAKRAKS
ncbi:MAG: hypothetical protein QF847_01875 [Candidatus Marinimicrobia bacterium]|jgi:hypothetical protein|nr:hypothetical protein [Candidatus Neomarinimicrobiota bacterium]|tara:strand:+ start:372 stop:1580 length:1209 start_codon:yes stop_codon:yes gene_type:complete